MNFESVSRSPLNSLFKLAVHMALQNALSSFSFLSGERKHFWILCAVLSLEILFHRHIALGEFSFFLFPVYPGWI